MKMEQITRTLTACPECGFAVFQSKNKEGKVDQNFCDECGWWQNI